MSSVIPLIDGGTEGEDDAIDYDVIIVLCVNRIVKKL